MKCMWKFAADSKVRPAKLSINKKRVIKCAAEQKMRHLREVEILLCYFQSVLSETKADFDRQG